MLKALIDHLLNTTAVTDVVSTRIYAVVADRAATPPYIVIQKISGTPDSHAQGPGIADARYQLDIYGEKYADIAGLGKEGGIIETALNGFQGDMQGVEMLYIDLINSQDLHNATAERFRISKDFRLRARI